VTKLTLTLSSDISVGSIGEWSGDLKNLAPSIVLSESEDHTDEVSSSIFEELATGEVASRLSLIKVKSVKIQGSKGNP